MTRQFPRIPIIGYCHPLSVRPGEIIGFKVSCAGDGDFSARVLHSICADANPDGPGIIEKAVETSIEKDYTARPQAFNPGSYAIIETGPTVEGDLTIAATIWPTLPGDGEQVIFSAGGFELFLDTDGALAGRVGGISVSTGKPLLSRQWCFARLSYTKASGLLTIVQQPYEIWTDIAEASVAAPNQSYLDGLPVLIAAGLNDGFADNHFDGKIEAPGIYAAANVDPLRIAAKWDFAKQTSSLVVEDTGKGGYHGSLVNHPARAMTGSGWDGSEMNWQHNPEHYGAIHFHRDDIYDFGWQNDIEWVVPEGFASGIYVLRITQGGHEDAIPFYVCPPLGQRTAELAVLVSTFTHVIYGNHSRPDFKPEWMDRHLARGGYPYNPAQYEELGCSTYNFHRDGSGICHCSHLRPLLNTRPGYYTMGYGKGSGLRHFQADSHLIWWLHEKGIPYDIVTDKELHEEEYSAIQGYKTVTTGSHPEYHTSNTLDALLAFRNRGGNFMYLGGNGFYWRVVVHEQALVRDNTGDAFVVRLIPVQKVGLVDAGEAWFVGQHGLVEQI